MSLIVVRQMSSGGLVRGCYGFAVWEVEQFKTLMWCAGFHYPDFEDSLKLVSEVCRSTNLVWGYAELLAEICYMLLLFFLYVFFCLYGEMLR